MLVMGLVLGQNLMVISTMDILLYAKVSVVVSLLDLNNNHSQIQNRTEIGISVQLIYYCRIF